VRNQPVRVHAVAAKAAAELIIDAAHCHAAEGVGRHLERLHRLRHVAGAAVRALLNAARALGNAARALVNAARGMAPQAQFQIGRMRELGRRAETAISRVETGRQIFSAPGRSDPRRTPNDRRTGGLHAREARDYGLALLRDLRSFGAVELRTRSSRSANPGRP